jgi:hypothetical protein
MTASAARGAQQVRDSRAAIIFNAKFLVER